MALLLNIDTATPYASVCITRDGAVLAFADNPSQKEHAAFMHEAIDTLLHSINETLPHFDAIAVTCGPGSYTGLRAGLSAAKGFCYAINKPLICVNTLEVMAHAAIKKAALYTSHLDTLYCPMIDARRMEVFTALYSQDMSILLEPCAMVLDSTSFEPFLSSNSIVFSGDGSIKFKNLVSTSKAFFPEVQHSAIDLADRALLKFLAKNFTDIAYAEPAYFKQVFVPQKPVTD